MKLVDANISIYAVNSDAEKHQASRRWLEAALSGTERVGLAVGRVARLSPCHDPPGQRPLAAEDALAYIDSWLQQLPVELVVPGPNHWMVFRALIVASGTAGNLTSDAHLAAHALEGGWTLVSTDHDFRRFGGLAVHNPTL